MKPTTRYAKRFSVTFLVALIFCCSFFVQQAHYESVGQVVNYTTSTQSNVVPRYLNDKVFRG